MISIDFGNSYTKVAVRPGMNESAVPVRDGSLNTTDAEGLEFCIPTLAGRIDGTEWRFGIQVPQDGSDTMEVFRNWKPRFFEGFDDSPMRRRKRSPSPPDQEGTIRQAFDRCVREAVARNDIEWVIANAYPAFRDQWLKEHGSEFASVTTATTANGDDAEFDDYTGLGTEFFRWLRGFVSRFCELKGFGPADEMPARVTLPSFGSQAGAELVLRQILSDAGWRIDRVSPTLFEPQANYWGLVSGGRNAVWVPPKNPSGETFPNYRTILQGSNLGKSLWRRMRANLNSRRRPIFWVLVADIGGYTLDFAMMGLDPYDPAAPVDGEHEGMQRRVNRSFALGVQDLDQSVLDKLPDRHAKRLREMLADRDAARLERFHRSAYQRHERVIPMGPGVRLGTAEKSLVQECLEEFAEKVTKRAEDFLTSHGCEQVDELVLSGGGFNIPMIRDQMLASIERWNRGADGGAFHAFAPMTAKEISAGNLPTYVSPSPSNLVRGATALGGASVAFDFAD